MRVNAAQQDMVVSKLQLAWVPHSFGPLAHAVGRTGGRGHALCRHPMCSRPVQPQVGADCRIQRVLRPSKQSSPGNLSCSYVVLEPSFFCFSFHRNLRARSSGGDKLRKGGGAGHFLVGKIFLVKKRGG